MNSEAILSTIDARKIATISPTTLKVEGFFIGMQTPNSCKALLVNRLEEPKDEIALPDTVFNYILENVPEIFRVGGPYLWLRQVVITGNIARHANNICFEEVALIEFTDSKKVLDFS